MRQTMKLCDIVRIDHFRGFESYWEIPAAAETAIDGLWQPGPGEAMFAAMRRELADETRQAEDHRRRPRHHHPDRSSKLREDVGLPGMRILHFAFGDDARNPYLPHNYDANTVVYTGTHDNDTTCGWWESLEQSEKDRVHTYLGVGSENSEELCWYLIRLAFSSVARYCVIPMQDALALDSTHRMNQPRCRRGIVGMALPLGSGRSLALRTPVRSDLPLRPRLREPAPR
jgi:4-alpha-glucanotransferase